MKAVEVTGTIDKKGQLFLDKPIEVTNPSRVRVIVLFTESIDELESDSDSSIEFIKESLTKALKQASSGERIPLSQMWDGIDAR